MFVNLIAKHIHAFLNANELQKENVLSSDKVKMFRLL